MYQFITTLHQLTVQEKHATLLQRMFFFLEAYEIVAFLG